MVAAAVEALPGTRIAAVTVLTSLSDGRPDRRRPGRAGPDDAVRGWPGWRSPPAPGRSSARRRRSPRSGPRSAPDITLITPGVRPAGAATRRDQARVATPEQALADGADLLVIGPPITGAADAAAAAAAMHRVRRCAVSVRRDIAA